MDGNVVHGGWIGARQLEPSSNPKSASAIVKRRSSWCLVLLCFSACRSPSAQEHTVASAAPVAGSVAPGSVPVGFPEQVALYPEATLESSARTGGTRVDSGEQVVLLRTSDPPEAVIDFYREQLRNFEQRGTADLGGSIMVTWSLPHDMELAVTAATAPEPGTLVQLVVTRRGENRAAFPPAPTGR